MPEQGKASRPTREDLQDHRDAVALPAYTAQHSGATNAQGRSENIEVNSKADNEWLRSANYGEI